MKDFKKSTIYQIYPKSFNDSNGDGIGDLRGIIAKLDYLKELGIDCIWLTPFYISPQRDNGYDIADYYNVDPLFGTMKDFEELVEEAKKRNIELMLDMVFNHTSTEHKWFKKALNGDEKYKNFYIFKKGKNEEAPTNWVSKFGGSSWEYVEKFDEYYLHLFDKTQGDLNWENDEVRSEIYKVVNFWINKGVKGFRLDVINLISKPDIYLNDNSGDGKKFYTDGPKIHEFLKELNENTFGKYEDIVTVGEMSSTTIENCVRYSNPEEKELSMVFNFHHLKVDYKNGDKWTLMDFDFKQLKKIFKDWQNGMESGNGWNALFWCNHDQPRIVSRFGNCSKYHKESAKMLATSIHMMRGTPYIYQGEEFGMTNPEYTSINQYRDVESINFYNILMNKGVDKEKALEILREKSRDNSRTPVQWNNKKNAGFTSGEPWIPVGNLYENINAENALNDKDSVFYHYKNLISLRKQYDVISDGSFKIILENHDKVYAYTRSYKNTNLIVLNNFYGEDTDVTIEKELIEGNSKTLISNYKDSGSLSKNIKLRPYESIVYIIEK
ncbi:alpha,alpha-phosphotrehalase [Clostridium butyricum]|jgi:trehalose-6-phosphate hydrolase|uniref:Alpha,alpha-phosphotrehalase n=1 Tax=Clostridium butyricum TaxID=1492 RepID=A0A512TK16_CLOBU|nr:alpha,alpha-phosphotrehalase [Clostridium butyricum]ETI87486.1 MAG: Alpha,alpha-phosphotrehalase [Clostridium butyricum DORA_1]MDU1508605.1 alpha,alpha-phosphotrehalase [Clostridium butyricum]MDU4802879.1 alpha,alpha-phosphotrehalase [Clostridium butyricum]MDU5722475.1 alpha,alpha-phosphotrehalase [Clostridium butyricum]MDU5820709.1 alpha,alpha-phosphotrehalase [Clostridium butyricum]